MTENISFNDRLDYLKKEHGLTNKDLAGIVGVQDRTIAYYISGKLRPDIDKLIVLAEYFDCSTDYLLGFTRTSSKKFQNAKLQSWYDDLQFKDESEVTKFKNLCDFITETFISKR